MGTIFVWDAMCSVGPHDLSLTKPSPITRKYVTLNWAPFTQKGFGIRALPMQTYSSARNK